MKKTMAWRYEGRLNITVQTEEAPTKQEWTAYVETIRGLGDLRERRVLFYSYGGAPNPAQRAELLDVFKTRGASRTAVLTTSLLARAASMAVAWFNKDLKIFAIDGDQAAWDFLELTPEERGWVKSAVRELHRELGIAHAA